MRPSGAQKGAWANLAELGSTRPSSSAESAGFLAPENTALGATAPALVSSAAPAVAPAPDPSAEPKHRIKDQIRNNPRLIGFAMSPVAFLLLSVLRHYGLVAHTALWFYALVFLGSPLLSLFTDRVTEGRNGALYVNLRVLSHVLSVTVVIYMSGWGPEVVAAYGFVVVDNLSRSGARAWKIVSLWTVLGVTAGEIAISTGLAPSFLSTQRANALALLGTAVILFVARMLAATAEEKETAESAMRTSEDRFRSLVQNSYDTVLVITEGSLVTFASPAVTSLTGRRPEEVVGTESLSLIHPDDRERVATQLANRFGVATQDESPESSERAPVSDPVTFRMSHVDGSWRSVEATVSDLRDRPAVAGYVANLRDVTERSQAEEALAHQALHDPLTGLPNRALLGDRIQQAILRGRRSDTPAPVVMFLDLDRFKVVNDSLGHSAGDDVLVEVADRLKGVMRASDTLARFGGDEFVMLCEQIADREALLTVADRVLAALEPPFVVEGREFHVGASVGAAVIEGDDVTADELLSDADSAMYLAKAKSGRSRIQIFDKTNRAASRYRVHTEHELSSAIGNDELRIYYQPIVDLWTRRRIGVEALLRWQHPERGLLGPGEFLDVAEQTGLIVPIGSWALRTACAQVRCWNDQLAPDHQLALAVNLSARQLAEPDVVDEVSSVLVDAGISPRALRLVLDLTESLHPADEDETRTHVRQLHRMGVVLAIDDFGVGYSSLEYMRDLPIGVVKIDRSFISAIGRSARDEAIIRSIVDLSHSLDLTVTAKGVETEAQLEFMCEIGCDTAQGFLLGPPEPPAEVDIHSRLIQFSTSQERPDDAIAAQV
jgi:diguanylate cyclase (GGDEF)-like protein/PAS domain S-box-containing protein